MPTLGSNKPTLLNQVKKKPNITLDELVRLLNIYDDLQLNDFRGYVSDVLYEQLREAGRNPLEAEMWSRIQQSPRTTTEDVHAVQDLVAQYLRQFPGGPNELEARSLQGKLMEELNGLNKKKLQEEARKREENDWSSLERGNYFALQTYKRKYPDSVHKDELDDLMWNNTRTMMNSNTLSRYLSDWPSGRHYIEASTALQEFPVWEAISRKRDLFEVDDYRDNHPESPFINEINSLYYTLREEMLSDMKKNPSEFDRDLIIRLLDADIFKQWEFFDFGLMTEESWETLCTDRSLFPDIQDYQIEDPNIQAPAGSTDVYLFGTPGTGKTCLLMGLAGANGDGYTINMKLGSGGDYAAALQEYVNAGLTPGRTFGKFVTTIHGHINEEDKRDNTISHNINLVEMSGEEFALRIADSKEVSLADMGTGATNLLRNGNRKVFFIIVDPSKDKVKVQYLETVRDSFGNEVEQRIRTRYVSQLTILQKFVSLFEIEENEDIMKRVDAIHFIVTKADILSDNSSDRVVKARDLLLERYKAPVNQLKNYCERTKRINYSDRKELRYRPQVFTFSLGHFYLGDVFDFDKSETLKIIQAIRGVTSGTKERTWWDKFKESLA